MEQQPIQDSEPTAADERALIDFMRQRDVACPSCDYNLRNLTALNCPECGTKLVLGVHWAEPFFTAWIVATIAMTIAGAPGMLLVAMVVRHGFQLFFSGQWPSRWVWLISTALIPGSILLVRFRRGFLRLSRSTQIRLAALSIVIASTVYCLLIRFR